MRPTTLAAQAVTVFRVVRPAESRFFASATSAALWERDAAASLTARPPGEARIRGGGLRGPSNRELAAVEGLGPPVRGVALDGAQPHDRFEGLGPEPRARGLRGEVPQDQLHLPAGLGLRQGDEEVGRSQIAF